MGDACPWECDYAYFRDTIVVDRDQNETADICRACDPSACAPGIEEYFPARCQPQSNRSAFCRPCPQASPFSRLAPTSLKAGHCQYECAPNVSYRSSLDQQCKPCQTQFFCPAGFRRVCDENPCVACPAAMPSSMAPMPSNGAACQVACKDGYLALDARTGLPMPLAVSYDAGTIACASCAQRSCPVRSCPQGFFMPVPGSGICQRCATVYDCPLATFPSSCICTQCPPLSGGRVPILQAQAAALGMPSAVQGWGICPSVCPPNTMLLLDACVQCGSLGQGYFALWNASNGTRWWPQDQDPSFLPPRPEGPERRAGLCWPCPPGFVTLPGDPDLCLSVDKVLRPQRALAPISQGVVLHRLPRIGRLPEVRSARRLLQHGEGLCPPFASGNPCACNPGFERRGARCVLSACSRRGMRLQAHPDGTSLILHHPHDEPRRSAHAAPLPPLTFPGCAPGQQPRPEGGCAPCPRGSFSRHTGLAPCIPCARALTTLAEGSLSPAQCVVPRIADRPFALPAVERI